MAAGRRDASSMQLNTFAINKWEDLSLGSLYNAAIAKKRNSALLNALTAFGEERRRQYKRKFNVLVRCMKLAFLFLCYVLGISFINSKCYSH